SRRAVSPHPAPLRHRRLPDPVRHPGPLHSGVLRSGSPEQPGGARPGLQLCRGADFLLPAPQLAGVEGDEGERMSLTTKIREYRVRDKLNQEELAQKVGVRRETIGNL